MQKKLKILPPLFETTGTDKAVGSNLISEINWDDLATTLEMSSTQSIDGESEKWTRLRNLRELYTRGYLNGDSFIIRLKQLASTAAAQRIDSIYKYTKARQTDMDSRNTPSYELFETERAKKYVLLKNKEGQYIWSEKVITVKIVVPPLLTDEYQVVHQIIEYENEDKLGESSLSGDYDTGLSPNEKIHDCGEECYMRFLLKDITTAKDLFRYAELLNLCASYAAAFNTRIHYPGVNLSREGEPYVLCEADDAIMNGINTLLLSTKQPQSSVTSNSLLDLEAYYRVDEIATSFSHYVYESTSHRFLVKLSIPTRADINDVPAIYYRDDDNRLISFHMDDAQYSSFPYKHSCSSLCETLALPSYHNHSASITSSSLYSTENQILFDIANHSFVWNAFNEHLDTPIIDYVKDETLENDIIIYEQLLQEYKQMYPYVY